MPNNNSKELIAGSKFNRLTVIKLDHKDNRWRRHYLCKCDCGKEKVIQGSLLVSGNTRSCGCLGQEVRRAKLFPDHRGVINHLILQYKRHARNREIPFNLSYEEFKYLTGQPCHYCGIPPSNIKYTKNCKEGFIYSGIDRVDSDGDYSKENTVSCCSDCNRAKNNMPLKNFQDWVQRLCAMATQWSHIK